MKNSKLVLYSIYNSLGVLVYVAVVAYIIFNGEQLFGKMANFWGPVAFLLLFVLSATMVGLLIFGRPLYLYWEGLKSRQVGINFSLSNQAKHRW